MKALQQRRSHKGLEKRPPLYGITCIGGWLGCALCLSNDTKPRQQVKVMKQEAFSLDTKAHENFEELAVLLVTGQADQAQRERLDEHLRNCQRCRVHIEHLRTIGAELLQMGTNEDVPAPDGMTERFVARARSQGIHLTISISKPQPKFSKKTKVRASWFPAVAAVACTLCIVAVTGLRARRWFLLPSYPRNLAVASTPPESAEIELIAENARILKKLEIANRKVALLQENLGQTLVRIQDLTLENADIRNRLSLAEQKSRGTEQLLAAATSERQSLEDKLAQVDSDRVLAIAASRAEQSEVTKLQEQIGQLQGDIAQQERLLGEASEAKRLITARRLHLVDVFDHDSDPNAPKPFGRIYYAEGQKLIF